MKILQIIPELNEGGVERGTIDFAIYLKNRGHTSMVMSNGGHGVSYLQKKEIAHSQWPVHRKNPWTILKLSFKLRRFIKIHRIDIVHTRSRVPAWIAWLATRKQPCLWIVTGHGMYRPHFFSRIITRAHHFIVATETVRSYFVNTFGIPSPKISIIERGVRLEEFPFRAPCFPTIPTLAMIGRLSPIKGHRDFLTALSLLKKKNILFQALIVGATSDDAYEAQLKQWTLDLNLSSEVQFLGHRSDVSNILKEVQILVLASTYPETFGRVIVEAQASGVCVIATDVGSISKIVEHPKTGILVPPHHPEKLAAAIEEVLTHPEESKNRILAARKKVESFYDDQVMFQKTVQLYETLLTPQKILIIKFSSLGDHLLIVPSVRALRKKFPNAYITLLCDPRFKEIWKFCPYLNETLTFPKKHLKFHWSSLVKKLKEQHFDLSIDFQNTFWTHWATYLASIPKRYGYARKNGKYWLTHALSETTDSSKMPPVEHQFRILQELEISLEDPSLEFWPSPENESPFKNLCEQEGLNFSTPYALIHIGASWPTKRWHPPHIANVCTYLQDRGFQIVFSGENQDQAFLHEILSHRTFAHISLLGKTNFQQFSTLIQHSALVISPDSAACHLAAAFQRPTLALFGPTDAAKHRSPSPNLRTLQEATDCGPCYRSTCWHHSCMVQLKPSRVIQTLKEMQPTL